MARDFEFLFPRDIPERKVSEFASKGYSKPVSASQAIAFLREVFLLEALEQDAWI
jgi:hypothetical protein